MGFSVGGHVSLKFSAPPSGKTMHHTPSALEVQEHARGSLGPCLVWWGSDFTRRHSDQKCSVFLFVCPSCFGTTESMHSIRCWSTEKILILLCTQNGTRNVVIWRVACPKVMKSFNCRGCMNRVTSTGCTSVDISDSANLELVDKFCYLGDMFCWCSCGSQNLNWMK